MNYELRTKTILSDSLNELIQHQRFENITVKDIVANCDVSRATFYRYFKDKYELMIWYYQKQHAIILESNPELSDWNMVTLQTVELIYRNKQYFKNIVAYKNQNSFLDFIYEKTHYYFVHQLQKKLNTKNLSTTHMKSIEFYCAGIIHLLEKWIISDMPETPEEFTALLCSFIPNTLKELIRE